MRETERTESTHVDTQASEAPISPVGKMFLLRPDVTFLNHGSFGACPAPVFETYQRWQRELEAQPVEFLGRRIHGLLCEAREPLARFLGAQPDDIVYVPNATHGVNIVARSLPLGPDDEVVVTELEYGAVQRTWRYICGQRGATYRPAHVSLPVTTAEALVDEVWSAVTPRTRAIVVSHITSTTALILPVAEICRRAREAGILSVVDGAHAPGHIPLALDALGADFYAGNCHKWLCAPKGAGFLYVRPERQALLGPLVVSWGYEASQPSGSPFQDLFGWVGTDDPSAYLSVPAAIAFQQQYDWPAVRTRAHELLRQARASIAALTGLPPLAPDSPEWWVQMAALPIRLPSGQEPDAFQAKLREQYQIEVPITEAGDMRFVRISIQAYNSPADVERLVRALGELL
jgi:isopenicillin-N epimerase